MQVHFAPLTFALLPLIQAGFWFGFVGVSALAVLGVVGLVWLLLRRNASPAPKPEDPYSERRITQTFIASIPTLTPQLNLEVATTKKTEVIERTDSGVSLAGLLDLGTNKAQIKVPVTYRYHLQLRDPWHLSVVDETVIVRAPALRAALPPAIHTDGMEQWSTRGWGRISSSDLLAQLQKGLTETLNLYANDPDHLALARETGRKSVADFVRLWLDREWQSPRFTQIQVQFTDEPGLSHVPTTRFLNDP